MKSPVPFMLAALAVVGCTLSLLTAQQAAATTKQRTIHADWRDRPIRQVVNEIVARTDVSVRVDADVIGRVTLKLRGIPWRVALDLAVESLGYVVVPSDTASSLRVRSNASVRRDLVTRAIRVRHLPLDGSQPTCELLAALRRQLTPEIGSLGVVRETSTLVVTDTVPVVSEISAVVRQMDVEPRTVSLDVEFFIGPGSTGLPAYASVSASEAACLARRLRVDPLMRRVRVPRVVSFDHRPALLAVDSEAGEFGFTVAPHIVPGTGKLILDLLDFTTYPGFAPWREESAEVGSILIGSRQSAVIRETAYLPLNLVGAGQLAPDVSGFGWALSHMQGSSVEQPVTIFVSARRTPATSAAPR